VARVQLHEIVDGVDGDYQLVEGKVGVVLKAQMVNFPVLAVLQYFHLDFRAVAILPDIPDLKVPAIDVRLEVLEHVLLWVGDVV
jgi:hypothetical protein